eukprot:9502383-Pyramimonas_sp.AAC.1
MPSRQNEPQTFPEGRHIQHWAKKKHKALHIESGSAVTHSMLEENLNERIRLKELIHRLVLT